MRSKTNENVPGLYGSVPVLNVYGNVPERILNVCIRNLHSPTWSIYFTLKKQSHESWQ